jgi:hypothetical protein
MGPLPEIRVRLSSSYELLGAKQMRELEEGLSVAGEALQQVPIF